jgi:hypothetical protein
MQLFNCSHVLQHRRRQRRLLKTPICNTAHWHLSALEFKSSEEAQPRKTRKRAPAVDKASTAPAPTKREQKGKLERGRKGQAQEGKDLLSFTDHPPPPVAEGGKSATHSEPRAKKQRWGTVRPFPVAGPRNPSGKSSVSLRLDPSSRERRRRGKAGQIDPLSESNLPPSLNRHSMKASRGSPGKSGERIRGSKMNSRADSSDVLDCSGSISTEIDVTLPLSFYGKYWKSWGKFEWSWAQKLKP